MFLLFFDGHFLLLFTVKRRRHRVSEDRRP